MVFKSLKLNLLKPAETLYQWFTIFRPDFDNWMFVSFLLTTHLHLSVWSDRLHRRQVRRAIAAGECVGWDQADLLEMLTVTRGPQHPETPLTPPQNPAPERRLIFLLSQPLPLYLLDRSFCCSSFKTTHFQPVSCLCLTCIWLFWSRSSSSAYPCLSIVLTVHDVLSWELDFFGHCRCLELCAFFFIFFFSFVLFVAFFFSVLNSNSAFFSIKQRVCPGSQRMRLCLFRMLTRLPCPILTHLTASEHELTSKFGCPFRWYWYTGFLSKPRL